MKSIYFLVLFMVILVISCGRTKTDDQVDEVVDFTKADTSIMESKIESDSVFTNSVRTKAGKIFKIKNKTIVDIYYRIANFDDLFDSTMGYKVITIDGVEYLNIKVNSHKNSKNFTIKEGANIQSPYEVSLEVVGLIGIRNTPQIIVDP